ncbi:MAG: porin [Gammaproteobacteria bacterium]|nr:porin [Gammaproteobacteria bacterium]
MKIKATALLGLTILTSPLIHAETTIYGRLDNMLNYIDAESNAYDISGNRDPSNDTDSDSNWDINTRSTRIGVKGSEDLGNGHEAFFHAEWAFNSTEGGSTADAGFRNRLAYAGIRGDWGSGAIGRQWTPFYKSVNKTDVWNNNAYNSFYLGLFRTGNALTYQSPDFNGFSAALLAIVDGDNKAKDGVDAWNISGDYQNGPASLGLSYYKRYEISGSDDSHLAGIAGSWNFGTAKLIAQYETGELLQFGTQSDDVDDWAVMGEYYLGNNILRALYGGTEINRVDSSSWALGWQYNFSKRTRAYLEYGLPGGVARDTNGTYKTGEGDLLTLGLRHYF